MSKRSSFARRLRDFYPTPPSAAAPLRRHLPDGARYWEPCAGDGALIEALAPRARCVVATDIAPRCEGIHRADVLGVPAEDIRAVGLDLIVTNPPWPMPGQGGAPVTTLIDHLAGVRPLWLLLAWDVAANGYFERLRPICPCIVPIGRVSWAQNGVAGKDNAAWYLFDARLRVAGPVLLGAAGRTAVSVHATALRRQRRPAEAVAA
ncbi:hypothetical protein [Jannaschia formosa]|uniref:hypothetical protein n=1 Tax=Jannaschia formosa TaxID=2259592 RepID=UPI000E1C0307|nr:hypothetical protein [Jannaschia formosa]TFL16417.1 hypothetical protein DR046_20045 [Jannaschia formosa]